MMDQERASFPNKKAEAVALKRRRKATDYLVPPIVVPAALSVIILIYVLVRGPV